ncbi:MAG: hypothetical protein AAB397_04140 [Patescibacteria group bacterium]
MENEIKKESEQDFLAHAGMSWKEIDELNEKLRRAIRETNIELGELL